MNWPRVLSYLFEDRLVNSYLTNYKKPPANGEIYIDTGPVALWIYAKRRTITQFVVYFTKSFQIMSLCNVNV
jgi:hypothetical protein